MAFTPTQLTNAISISGTFSLINGAAVITDTTPYLSLGIVSPYTVKTLLYIQNPVGQSVYKNTGYDAANFASPDMQPLAGTGIGFNQFGFTMPTDITGAYMQGQYTINMKVQVYDGTSQYTDVFKALYQNVTAVCNGIKPCLQPTVSYNPAQVGITDSTQYGLFISLANTLTLYPPQNTGAPQSQTFSGSPATLYWVPPTSTLPYTGIWQWTLSTVLTYFDQVTQAATTCLITANGNFDVTQNPICKVRCFVSEFEQKMWAAGNCNEGLGLQLKQQFEFACSYLTIMVTAIECGVNINTVNRIADKIYKIIGADPDCSCSCNDGTSQQMVSLNSTQGTPGTNGLSFRQGNGVPSGGLGIIGDSYLNNATDDIYLKTGASTWTLETNIKGATGAAGTNGTSLIWSDSTDASTATTGSFTQINTGATDNTNPAKNLVSVGDALRIYSTIVSASGTSDGTARILFNATVLNSLNGSGLFLGNSQAWDCEILMTLTDATANAQKVRVETKWKGYSPQNGGGYTVLAEVMLVQDFSGLNFNAAAQNFYLQVTQTVANDIVGKQWQCEILKKL